MYVRINAFISTALVMHVLVNAYWNRHTIKSILAPKMDEIEMLNISFYQL